MPLLFLVLTLFCGCALCLPEDAFHANPCSLPAWSSCECHSEDSSVQVECSSGRLGKIPALPSPSLSSSLLISISHDHLPVLPQDSFGTAEIASIHLSHDNILTVNANAFRGLEDTLRIVRLNNNKLSELPSWSLSYLTQLHTLDLQSNRISSLRAKAFEETQLSSLHFLYLGHNQIESLPSQCMRRLRLLVLSLPHNRLSTLEKLSLPPTLTILDLSGNLLEEIPYLALQEQPSLREINLEGNRISKMDYNPEVKLPNEMKLILRNNRIGALSPTALKSFRKFSELDLSYNEISFISPLLFETISQVKDLNLAHNRITNIKQGTFENVGKSVERVSLAWNELHTLPEALIDLRVLTSLSLEGNKLSKVEATRMTSFKDSLTELSLAYNHLAAVPADVLQSLPALKLLDLSKNRLESVASRWRVGHLRKLLLAANSLSSVDLPTFFAHSPLLTLLDLSFNRIQRIGVGAFGTLPVLDTLFLQHNQLEIMPRDALITQGALQTLVLDSNLISSLPAQSTAPWPRLSRLSLHANHISTLDERAFSTSFSLSYLDLSANLISRIKSHSFELLRLHTLLLSHNHLKQLDAMTFSHMTEMRAVNVSHNRLLVINPRAFFNVTGIDRLDLSHNKLEHIEPDAFYELRRVGHLDLSRNRLKLFACHSFSSPVRADHVDFSFNLLSSVDISCLKSSLSGLNLSHNQLSTLDETLLEGAPSLESLSLSHNTLLSISARSFEALPSLRHIDLSHNHLRIIRKGTFAHQNWLESVNLSHNALVSLHADVLGAGNVGGLGLAGNQLTSIPVEGLRSVAASLEWIDLADNYISSVHAIQLTALTALKKLVLARNRLQSLEEEAFASLPRLEELDLRENPLSSWHPQAFKSLSQSIRSVNLAETGLFSIPRFDSQELEDLDLSNNKIGQVEGGQVEGLPRLHALNLSSNAISSLPDRIFSNISQLTSLDLSHNPLRAITEQHITDLPRLETLVIRGMHSLYAVPSANAFATLSLLRHLEMTSLHSAIVNYNLSAILGVLPPLTKLAVQINEARLAEQLHSADYRAMKWLTVTGVSLKEIDVGAFKQLRGYEFELRVVNTSISHFAPSIFDTLTGIQRLSLILDDNQLTSLSPFTHTAKPLLNRHATLLQDVSLLHNPIACDCSMEWFSEWAAEGQPCWGRLGRSPLECSSPPFSLISLCLVFVALLPFLH